MGDALSIAEVSARTGIPVPTLRFYEKELPVLFRIAKTAGGHRRYTDEDARHFSAVRRLTGEEGLRLSELKELLAGAEESRRAREIDLLLEVHETETRVIDDLRRRVESLEKRLASIPPAPPRLSRLFPKGK